MASGLGAAATTASRQVHVPGTFRRGQGLRDQIREVWSGTSTAQRGGLHARWEALQQWRGLRERD